MLEIKNGGMAVNGHRLFGNLSFTIHEGEVLGVLSVHRPRADEHTVGFFLPA